MFLLRWLWKNMKGDRAVYIFALCMTVVCQSMYIITPFIIQQITDTFLVGEQAAENLRRQVKGYLDEAAQARGEISDLKRQLFKAQQGKK